MVKGFFANAIANVVVAIVTLLLVLFPNCKDLNGLRQEMNNGAEDYAPAIVEAFKKKDVQALEDLMCANIKKNEKNLKARIQKMYDSVQGEITETSWEVGGGSFSQRTDENMILQVGLSIYLTTTKTQYQVRIWWETVNVEQPEETQIRSIRLAEMVPVDELTPLTTIMTISATEGVMAWHE